MCDQPQEPQRSRLGQGEDIGSGQSTPLCERWQLRYAPGVIVIAHNIRSLHNVGSIFRNAAAFGIEQLWLTGYTAAPPRKEIAKVALGAEELVPWATGEIGEVIAQLRGDGYRVLGLETGEEAKDIAEVGDGKIALVLGNEVEGIDDDVRALLDGLVMIPMAKKQSLNVSVACGVAMYCVTAAKGARACSSAG